jgi:hypothetical protein
VQSLAAPLLDPLLELLLVAPLLDPLLELVVAPLLDPLLLLVPASPDAVDDVQSAVLAATSPPATKTAPSPFNKAFISTSS